MADKPKRIPWLKYLLGGFIFLFLLLIIFYQPLLFGVAQLIGQQVAQSQNLSLQFKIHGSIVSDLYLEDVHLEPLPGNNSFPVERLQARRVGARYNLLSVFRRDFLNLVDLIEAKDIDLAFRPTPAPPQPQQKPAGPLRLVPVIPKKIDITNVNVTVHENGGDFVVRNLALQFAQDRPGYLALDRLAVPALGQWQNLHADISVKQNVLQLAGLSIEPLLKVNQLSVDLNGLESGRLGLALAGRVLDADLTAQGSLTQEANAVSSVTVKLANLQMDRLGSLVSVPMRGSVPAIDCALSGDLQRPQTWDGRVLFTANNLQYLTYRVDDASATVTLTQGTGRIDPVIIRSGPNVVFLNGNFRLPPDWENFPARVSANLGLAVALQDPALYLPGARGSALVSGNIGLASGQAKSMIQIRAAGLGTEAVETSTARVNILAAAQVPFERDLWYSLAAVATANVGNIRAQQAHVADVSGSLDLRNGSSAELSGSVRSGGSNCDLNAHALLPAAGSAFDSRTIDGRLRFHVASISDFIEQQLVSGTFTADGDLTVHDLQPDGYIKAAGTELKFRDLVVPRVEVNATAANRVFKLDKCHLSFDESDYIDANGRAALVDPFSYQAYGRINFSDLKTFNGLLKSFGLDQGLSGTLNASFTGQGDLKSQIPEANLVVSGNQITYRGLVLQDLEVNGDIKDKRLNLPTLKIVADSNNSISATGNAQLSNPLPYSFNTNINLNDLAFLNPLLKSLGQEGGLSGKLHGTAWAQGEGQTRGPTGVVQLAGERFSYRNLQVQNLNVQARADGNQATLENVSVNFDPNNYINVNGNLALAEPFNYEAFGRVSFSDLKTFNALLKSFGPDPGLSGTLNASFTGQGDLKSQIQEANLVISGNQITYRGVVLQDVEVNGDIKDKRLNLPTLKIVADSNNSISAIGNAELNDRLPYGFNANIDLNDLGFLNPLLKSFGQQGGLSGKLHGSAWAQGTGQARVPTGVAQLAGEQFKYHDLQVQNLNVQAKADGNQATLENAAIYFDPNNYVNLNGNAVLADPLTYEAYGRINFSDLRTFNALLKSFGLDQGLSGTLNASFTGKGDLKNQIPEANLAVSGSQIRYHGLVLRELEIGGDVKDKKLDLPVLKIIADQNNSVNGSGNALLTDPFPYESNLDVDFKDLRFLNPLLKSFGQDLGLAGKLGLTWSGKGELRNSVGTVRLNITGLQTKQVRQVQVDVEGHYEGLTAEVPKLQVTSPFGNLDATLRATPESIEIPSLSVRRGENVLTGNVQLPLNLESGAKLPIAFDKPIVINLRADRVSLASLQPGKPQVTGNIGLNVQASGTVRDPIVQIQTKVEDLRSPQMKTFAAATAQLQINLAQNTLTLDGGLKQADIQPLQIQGKIPLNLEQIIDSGRLPLDTPLQVAVKWPDTNLAFVRRLTPLVRVLEGNVAIDANVSGTLAKPNLAGEVRARITRFKAQTDVVPPLSDFNLNVALNQDHVTINQLGGNAAGGPFSVRGSIDLSNGTNPQIDLTVTGRQMLLTRSDNVIVRSNLDLTLRGPLAAVDVAGKIGITNSKFFQDIDILPLNLPGQPAPQPAGPPPNVSIDTPPLRDWKFNIKVQTDEPFLIQSNLARGEVLIDLQVGGTGLKPTVAGNVHIKRLTASLPFSHMDIAGSYINFSPDRNPLDPQLNIIGNSTVRDYEVTMRIFGPVSDFRILFDSSPPLSQGDIATLLATGATSSEFVQDPSLLAGRAAFLLIRKAYSSVFKGKANQQQEEFLNRLQVDVIPGVRVGTQDVSARFTLTKTWQVVAEFGSIGNVSGQLRYLIRFR